MRRALIAVAGVLVLAVMAVGVIGSAAWFTDQSTVPIAATSAKLDIRAEVAPSGGPFLRFYDPTGVPLTLTNLAPGVYSDTWAINVQNKPAADSTLAVKYRYRTAYVSGSGPLWANTVVKAEKGFCGANYTITFPEIVYEGPVSGMSFTNTDALKGNLPVNETHCFRFSFKLADAADNTLQGLTSTFNVVIDATQPENPGW